MFRIAHHAACLAAILFGGATLRADVVHLNTGGKVRGVVDRDGPADGPVIVETVGGTVIQVDRANVRGITWRAREIEQYETLARQTPDTAAAQWDLAEWCRLHSFKAYRDRHLQRVVAHEPNHEEARAALGHKFRNGGWVTPAEAVAAQGLVPHEGDFVTPQEKELIDRRDYEREAELAWFKKVKVNLNRLTSNKPNMREQGFAELTAITDPHATRALANFLAGHGDLSVRVLYVEILGQMSGPKPIGALVDQILRDDSARVRNRGMEVLPEAERGTAVAYFVRALGNENNVIVRRAAAALGSLGDRRAIPDLIEALVTVHKYRVRVPRTDSVGFDVDGSLASGGAVLPPEVEGMLLTGQLPYGVIIDSASTPGQTVPTKVVTIKRSHENNEARSALRALTEVDFGYDKPAWRLWWGQAQAAGTVSKLP